MLNSMLLNWSPHRVMSLWIRPLPLPSQRVGSEKEDVWSSCIVGHLWFCWKQCISSPTEGFFFGRAKLHRWRALMWKLPAWLWGWVLTAAFLLHSQRTLMWWTAPFKVWITQRPLVTPSHIQCSLNHPGGFPGQLDTPNAFMTSGKKRRRTADPRPALKDNPVYNCCLPF